MKYEKLIRENKIKPIKVEKEEIVNLLTLAERDLKTAKFLINQDWDWAFVIIYNSVLQACRAFMLKEGFRARVEETHKITFEFMKEALGKDYQNLIDYFDRARIRRHKTIYETTHTITETEVKQFLNKAENFVTLLKNKCLS